MDGEDWWALFWVDLCTGDGEEGEEGEDRKKGVHGEGEAHDEGVVISLRLGWGCVGWLSCWRGRSEEGVRRGNGDGCRRIRGMKREREMFGVAFYMNSQAWLDVGRKRKDVICLFSRRAL